MDLVIEAEDTEARFSIAKPDTSAADRERHLSILRESWDRSGSRKYVDDSEWIADLGQHLTHLVDLRVAHVEKWLNSNTQRFQSEDDSMEELRRAFNSAVLHLRASIQLCKSQCAKCNLHCIRNSFHKGDHDCLTSHECIHDCAFCDKEPSQSICGQPAGHSGDHACYLDAHPCEQRCELFGKYGCVDQCAKLLSHQGNHVCSAPVHMCGKPCGLKLPDGKSFSCSGLCRVQIYRKHKVHVCEHTSGVGFLQFDDPKSRKQGRKQCIF